jgi:hypothetical protein
MLLGIDLVPVATDAQALDATTTVIPSETSENNITNMNNLNASTTSDDQVMLGVNRMTEKVGGAKKSKKGSKKSSKKSSKCTLCPVGTYCPNVGTTDEEIEF